MNRPFGVTLLAIAAGVAGLLQIWRLLVFLGVVGINLAGESVKVPDPLWGQAIWAGLMAAIWFYVAVGFWNVRGYAYMFGVLISLFTLIWGFFAILFGSTSVEGELIAMIFAAGIYFYLNYPGVQQHFAKSEMDRLTPEQRAAYDQLAAANAAAAQADAAAARAQAQPAPSPQPPAAPPPSDPGAPSA